MPKMRAFQISKAKGPLELVERPIPDPAPGTVRIRVQACGICHSDLYTKDGLFPGIQFPRVPGHEIAGVVDAAGAGVERWKPGQRVGVGWFGGSCGYCDACLRGNLFACQTSTLVTGVTHDGGYADYMISPASAVAQMPDELEPTDAAPLMCAGVTTFNALRNSGARPGDLVAVLGLGGLGHLGVQFAARMGYRTAAIARGAEKEALARELGATIYIDSKSQDPSAELTKLGGAKAILATVTDGGAMSPVVAGLGVGGTMMVIGAGGVMEVPPGLLVMARRNIRGWYSGTAIDSQDALAFSVFAGVRSRNEIYPLDRAPEALERMLSGEARFRVVLKM